MKKYRKYIATAIASCLALCTLAAAYTPYVTASHKIASAYVFGYSDVTVDAYPAVMDEICAEARIYNDSTGSVMARNSGCQSAVTDYKVTATCSSSVFSSGSQYYIEAYGAVYFVEQLSGQNFRDFDYDYFTYSNGRMLATEEVSTEETTVARNKQILRGERILESFEITPSQYIGIDNTSLGNYLTTDDHVSIKQAVPVNAGDTIPVFFMNSAGDELLVVKQSASALNYLYTFTKQDDGAWVLSTPMTKQDSVSYLEII